jgi:uncharacterized membrane protein YidH (DUF202 family)
MSEKDQKREDRQFQYDLAQIQMYDAWFPTWLALIIFGFTLYFSAAQLPQSLADFTVKVVLGGIVFCVCGIIGILVWIIRQFVSVPKFEKKYGLVQ